LHSSAATVQVLVLNLIDKKKDQGKLGKIFQDLSDYSSHQLQSTHTRASSFHAGVTLCWLQDKGKSDESALQFVWFDFHKECANMK
jgi:hypothetical protein